MDISTSIEAHKEAFLNTLKDFLKIPSISTDSTHKKDIEAAATFLQEEFEKLNASEIQLLRAETGNPAVYAHFKVSENLPTILVYGHYDVQPVDPVDLWDTPPFNPTIKEHRIYARGASDDKGQMLMHLKALEAMLSTGETLPCNVKFIIEGEEEIGSESLETIVLEHKELLAADVILISDTSMVDAQTPTITTGLRGLVYLEIEATGPNRDLHSGLYGGAVYNPLNALTKILGDLQTKDGIINIPGIYDDVLPASDITQKSLDQLPFNHNDYTRDLGVENTFGEKGFSTLARTSIRPSFDINGIWGGFTGEGAKTVIASKAYAKISFRLVSNQNPDQIADLVEDHLQNICPKGIKLKINRYQGGHPVTIPETSKAYEAAANALKTTFNKEVISLKSGGSIPIVPMLKEKLNAECIMMGFGLSEDTIHSPNESFLLDNFFKGIQAIAHFHSEFSKVK